MAQLKIGVISSEVSPFSKTGGLADVAFALPKHLKLLNHEVVVVMPYYRFMDKQSLDKVLVGERDLAFGHHTYHVKFIRSTMPTPQAVPVYFIYQPELFSNRDRIYGYDDDGLRFAFFDYCVFALFETIDWAPDVLHCHEWQTGLIPNWLSGQFSKQPFWQRTVTLFTIHNLAFQMPGMWYAVPPKNRDRGQGLPPTDERALGRTNFTLRAIKNADLISTVSERYAQEILTKKFGEGLDGYLARRSDRVFGIINGIDYSIFNPALDPNVSHRYDWNSLDQKRLNKTELQRLSGLEENEDAPLIGLTHRLTEQKGFELIIKILPVLIRLKMQIAIVGSGSRSYISFFRAAVKKYPRSIAIVSPFTAEYESKVYAGSDMFLMPSRFEPCGISQLKSLRYGSIPIVHRTGGLADTITDFDPKTGVGTGFVFETYQSEDLLAALVRAIETYKYPRVWEHLTWQAMRQSFSWELPTRKYVELYKRAMRLRHAVD